MTAVTRYRRDRRGQIEDMTFMSADQVPAGKGWVIDKSQVGPYIPEPYPPKSAPVAPAPQIQPVAAEIAAPSDGPSQTEIAASESPRKPGRPKKGIAANV